LAEIIGEMNIIHPFREGNGRSIRTFIQLLAKAQNIVIDWSKITEQENIDASIAYINGDIKPFILLLKKCKI
jgi:cell filamentation protein